MAEGPSHDQRNSATFAALAMVLSVSAALLALVAFVLPQVLWIVLIAVVMGLGVILHYFVWGRWLMLTLREEEEEERRRNDGDAGST